MAEEGQRKQEGEREENGLVYRYSRAHRLEHAPEIVRKEFERRASGKKRGFFSFLTESRATLILFVTVLTLAAFFAVSPILSKLVSREEQTSIQGRTLSLSASRSDGKVFAELRLGPGAEGGEPEILVVRSSLDRKSYDERSFVLGPGAADFPFALEDRAAATALSCILELGGASSIIEARIEEKK